MNKSNNKRYQLTDIKIENALLKLLKDKDFNSIYINDICREANISRTAFYSHYDDINDLILKIQNKYHSHIINILIKDRSSLKNTFTRYFYYLKEHADFYKAFFNSPENRLITNQTYDVIFNLYPELVHIPNKTEREIKYHMLFIGAGIKSIAHKWILDGCIETPEQMSDILLHEYTP